MPFAGRSSELFREQMFAGRGQGYSSLGYSAPQDRGPGIGGDRVSSRHTVGRSKPYTGSPDLDQQMAEEVGKAMRSRQQSRETRQATDASPAPGSQEKLQQNVQMMEEIEQAIRRRKNTFDKTDGAGAS